jgi:membrane associated rhomboid family serine protease
VYYQRRVQFGFGGGLTKGVKWLIIANLVVYVIQILVRDPTANVSAFESWLGLVPHRVIHVPALWQFFTYMFLHDVKFIFHIIINMFVLWMFGGEIERVWGTREFLKYYIICGVGAGVFHLLFNWGSYITVIGASGAVFGVLVAFAVLFPNRVITFLLFFVIPINMKAKHLVMIFAGINLLGALQSYTGGKQSMVAHLAHLGGLLVGYLYLKGGHHIGQGIAAYRKRQAQSRLAAEARRQKDIRNKREEIDRILDRINDVGYDGLSEKEKKILKEASDFLSQE